MNTVIGNSDLHTLISLGKKLDQPCLTLNCTVRDLMMRTLLKIRDKQGNLVPLAANAVQRDYARRCGRRNIVLKARQMGMTTYVAARFFLHTITRPGTLTVQVAHDQRAAEEIFRVVHRFLENLPPRLRGDGRDGLRAGALITSRANARQIVFPRLDSEYRVETAGDASAGRGLTIHNLHCSEVARWPGDAAATLASLRAAVPPGGEIVLESTPNGAGGCFYQEWSRAPQTGYVRHFFPWWWCEDYTRSAANFEQGEHPVFLADFTDEERALMERHGLMPAQIAFRREIRASLRGLAAQEFAEDPVSCFLASGECVFDLEIIENRLAQLSTVQAQDFTPAGSARERQVEAQGFSPAKTAPDHVAASAPAIESRDNGRLQIWWPPRSGSDYVIGVDPAGGGVEGDYACAQVIERDTGLQCAELHGHFPPAELAGRVAALARQYNHALVAVERNNHGHGVLAHLAASENYERVYERGNQAGWLTSAATRPRMIEEFGAVLANLPQLFSSRRLLEECRTFVRRADGAPAAAQGAHDDCVMAMAIALAVRSELAGSRRLPNCRI